MIQHNMNTKAQIEVRLEVGVNYICFILANQGINWKNYYQQKYAEFLPVEHRQVLQECSADLTFANGNGGILTECFFFFPGYLNLKSEQENYEYYNLLTRAVESGDWSTLEERYQSELKHVREFYSNFLSSEESGRPSVEWAGKVKALGKVFCENFSRYEATVWPSDQVWLKKTAVKIPGLWGGEDIIDQWERQTRLQFNAAYYKILLVAAMNNGPSANSLAFDVNTFSVWEDESCLYYYKHFISHEIGTHLLLPVTINLQTDPAKGYHGYIAMENLAQYLNVKMFGFSEYNTSNEEYYHHAYFQKLYSELDTKHPEADVRELFTLAVEQASMDGISPG